MRTPIKIGLNLCVLPLMWAGTACGDEGVAVKITNDSAADVVVTVYDRSTNPERVVLTNARINGFASVPVSLVADANGKANLSWTATNGDATFPKCGHAEAVVANDASVSVKADSSCART